MSVIVIHDGCGLLITIRLWHPSLWLDLIRLQLFGPRMSEKELERKYAEGDS